MKEKKKKFNFVQFYLTCVVCIGSFAFLSYFWDWKGVFVGLLFLTAVYFIGKKEIPKYAFWLFLVMFLLRLLVIIFVKTPVESDFAVVFNAARSLIAGENTIAGSLYFTRYAYLMQIAMFIIAGIGLEYILNRSKVGRDEKATKK